MTIEIDEFGYFKTDDEALSLESAIFQALGAVSMCWEFPYAGGEFQSSWAKEIGDNLVSYIRNYYSDHNS